jgi:S1-C subfamily serine protease
MNRAAARTYLASLAVLGLLAALPAQAADEKASLPGIEKEFREAIKKVTPATVVCLAKGAHKEQDGSSGVLVSRNGLVLSDRDAAHVMKEVTFQGRTGLTKGHDVTEAEIRVPDVDTGTFKNYRATVIRRSHDADSMLLRITNPPKGGFKQWVSMGSSDDLRVGDFTFAVGNSFGLSKDALPSLTAGVVSSLIPFPSGHPEGRYETLTTSAAVNPGVNGGPVVDVEGRLVGTVSTYLTADDENECGQYLAKVIPVQRLRKIYGDLPEAAELFPEAKPTKSASVQAGALETAFHEAAQASYGAVASLVVERTDKLRVCFPTPAGPEPMNRFVGPVSALVVGPKGELITSLYNLTNTISLAHPPGVGEELKDDFTLDSGLKTIIKITACFADGRKAPAQLVSYDPHLAVAFLKADLPADAAPLPVLKPAAADAFREGRFALALGNPFGEKPLPSPLLTVGILSKEHAVTMPAAWRGNWQTDAAATDANCGGALVNLRGELYGMLQIWDAHFHGRSSGIGFVVPWTAIEAALPDLRAGKAWKRAWLGIVSDPQDPQPRVKEVAERSPAAAAGLKPGDRILAIDGYAPLDLDEMMLALRYRFAGDRVRLTIGRTGEKKPLEILVTLAERPKTPADEGKVPPPAVPKAAQPTALPASSPPPDGAPAPGSAPPTQPPKEPVPEAPRDPPPVPGPGAPTPGPDAPGK